MFREQNVISRRALLESIPRGLGVAALAGTALRGQE